MSRSAWRALPDSDSEGAFWLGAICRVFCASPCLPGRPRERRARLMNSCRA